MNKEEFLKRLEELLSDIQRKRERMHLRFTEVILRMPELEMRHQF